MIEILFEDDFLVIVNKPSMVLSQPSFNKERIPIRDLVEQQRPDLKGHLYLHHRLDFETSGVFLMSKNKSVNKAITEMFQNHDFEKTYLCLTKPHELSFGKKVEGSIVLERNSSSFVKDSQKEENTTTTNANAVEELSWVIKSYMAPAKGMGSHKKRMISVKSGGWPSETHFTILAKNSVFFLVEAKPKTGRTHQIRHHLQESHRSILGDNIYGGKSSEVPRLMLHAASLKFSHPHFKTEMLIEAPLPKDFQTVLDKYK